MIEWCEYEAALRCSVIDFLLPLCPLLATSTSYQHLRSAELAHQLYACYILPTFCFPTFNLIMTDTVDYRRDHGMDNF